MNTQTAQTRPDTWNEELDAHDTMLLRAITQAWSEREGPRVGDFVRMPGEEKLRRFTMAFGDGLQTTPRPGSACYGDTSFHIRSTGFASYSGSLEAPLSKSRLTFKGEMQDGVFWLWHHGSPGARRGRNCEIACRVYVYKPQ